MNLLLVDDDAYVTEAIKASLDWDKLGVKEVYTACSVSQAKKIIEDVKIHILICDIEMPKENGFVLISWIKDKKFLMKYILLTSYAEFEYANQAIKLNSFAYTLKPIDYAELEKIIEQAVCEEKELLESEDYRKVYDTWNESEKNRKEFFWRSVLIDKHIVSSADMEKEIQRSHFGYHKDTYFLPFVFEYDDCQECIKNLGMGMFWWTVRNIVEDIFMTKELKVESVLTEKNQSRTVVLRLEEVQNRESVIRKAQEFIDQMEKYFHGYWSITVGEICKIDQIVHIYNKILEVNMQDVNREGKVLLMEKCHSKDIPYTAPKWKLWEKFMEDMHAEALVEEVWKYLDDLTNRNQMNGENLSRFLMEFIEHYSAVFRKKDHATDCTDYHIELIKNQVNSVRRCKNYIAQMIRNTMWIAHQKAEALSIAEVVRQYIDNHIEESITRESLAEMVFLNADYLARIFKKDVGESIGTYILNRRMEIAKEYLAKTEEPVNVVASKVGYDNFSYFSKVFKAETSMSPKEFRRKFNPNEI